MTSDLLGATLERLASGLAAQVRPGVGLWDPDEDLPTPADHYGQLACALALRLMIPSGLWREPWLAWQALDADCLGHAPFNRFLLLLLHGVEGEAAHGRKRSDDVLKGLHRCRLYRSYPSNNWSLLAQLCRLMEARGGGQPARAHARLLSLFDSWMTPAGGFIDYPRRPTQATGQLATPVTYHHKALFVAVVAGWLTGDARWRGPIRDLLQWSQLTWDGFGHAGGFGRSTHAIFGEACLLASLILLGASEERHRESAHGRMLAGVLRRWQGQFRSDHLLALNPAGTVDPRAGYDAYMHLSVYNAWAAAVLAWARHAARVGPLPEALDGLLRDADPQPFAEDPVAGLVRAGSADGMLALVSTRGQPPQVFSETQAELRYAGGIPFHLTWRGQLLCPPSVRVPREALEQCPAVAGWTPVFRVQRMLYGLTDFGVVTVEPAQSELCIHFSGVPRDLLRREPSRWDQRVLLALDWRILGGVLARGAALVRGELPELQATLVLRIGLDEPVLEQELTFCNRGSHPIEYLNPCGHALIRDVALEQRNCVVHRSWELAPSLDRVFTQAPLDSSLPHATGHCLPPVTLHPGQEIRSQLRLAWRQ